MTQGQYGKNIGSRVFLTDGEEYTIFKLKNREFSFTVDVSNLPCGLNGALYFVEMDKDGGKSQYFTNKAGAKYGTGYCDAQCPHDIKFINGKVHIFSVNNIFYILLKYLLIYLIFCVFFSMCLYVHFN